MIRNASSIQTEAADPERGTASHSCSTSAGISTGSHCRLIKWPTQLQVRRHLPRAFQHFPRTRCIGCTEFMLQKQFMPSIQRKSYSNYKHRNTAKGLVAVTPHGTFSFISDLWTGSISDRKIVERSGFLDLIELQDDVMAGEDFWFVIFSPCAAQLWTSHHSLLANRCLRQPSPERDE